MEGGFKVALLMTLVVAAMLHGSCAQTTHAVLDSLGWTIPPAGDVAYRTWAALNTFRVGDVLVFNFTTGEHDVAEVTRTAYDSCSSTSPITISTDGPTRINLTSAGEHHFICTFGRHCNFGQRLSINVSSAAAPPPQPAASTPAPSAAVPATTPPPAASAPTPSAAVPAATPPAASAPTPSAAVPAATPPPAASTPAAAPSPSRVGNTYTVGGDALGWAVPPGGAIAYETWARTIRSFAVGDTLLFNFASGAHDVVEVSSAEFNSCNTTTAPIMTGPARIPLTSAGEHYYICTVGPHCSLGQRLAINVTGGGPTTMTPPSSSTPTTPSPATAPPPPSNSATSFAVAGLPFTFLTLALAFLV